MTADLPVLICGTNAHRRWWLELGLPCDQWHEFEPNRWRLIDDHPCWLIDGTFYGVIYQELCLDRVAPYGKFVEIDAALHTGKLVWHPLLPSVYEWAHAQGIVRD